MSILTYDRTMEGTLIEQPRTRQINKVQYRIDKSVTYFRHETIVEWILIDISSTLILYIINCYGNVFSSSPKHINALMDISQPFMQGSGYLRLTM